MKFSGNVNGPRTRWLSSGGILTFDHLKILGQGRWALIIKHCLHQPNHSPRIYLLGYYLWSLAGRYGSPQRGHSSLEPGVRSPSTWSLHVVHCLCAFFLVLLLPPTVQRRAFGPRWMDYSKLMNLGCDCEHEWWMSWRPVQGVPYLLVEGRRDRSACRNPWKLQTQVLLLRVETQPTKSELGRFCLSRIPQHQPPFVSWHSDCGDFALHSQVGRGMLLWNQWVTGTVANAMCVNMLMFS